MSKSVGKSTKKKLVTNLFELGDDKGKNSNITKISDLDISMQPDTVSFLDEAKKMKKCIVTMLSITDGQFIPEKTHVHCWWCKHNFENMPMSCPIRYVPNQVEKQYMSEITKDSYNIRENIEIKHNKEEFSSTEKINYVFYDKNYYETDGIFCSFNCVLAYIDDNKINTLYKNSKHLLKKIYFDLFETIPENLKPAPSWKLLKTFGGHLSIADYRKSFNQIEYIDKGKLVNIIKFKPIGNLYEEKAKL